MKLMDNVVTQLSHKHRQAVIWILLCLIPMVSLAIDLIAPSLPSISSSLHVSNSIVKNVISIYLLGYALGNFFAGFLTDALGRQKLLRIGLVCFILISLLPVIFPKIEVILLARLLQGLTIGAISVVARAIFSDILPPEELVNFGVVIGSVFGLGPIIGPLIGGYLQYYYGWKACFIFFSVAMLIILIPVYFIVPETHFNRQALNLKTIKTNILEILTHQKFMALVIIMGAVYSLTISFNTVGPFLIQTQLHYTPVFFGHIALVMGIFFLLSTFACRYLLKKFSVEQLLLVSINLLFAITILSVIFGYVYNNSIVSICVFSTLMFFSQGFIFPASMGKGISFFRHIAGTATAIMYLINISMTSAAAFILSFINVQSAVSLFWVYFVLLLICMVVFWRFIYKSHKISMIF